MISNCRKENISLTIGEKMDIKNDYLNGKSIDYIASKNQRHENTICLELVEDGIMHEKSPENVSQRHTYFEYGHFENVTDSDEEFESEYDPYDLNVHYDLIEWFVLKVKSLFGHIHSLTKISFY
jgi:hypothetical protein